MSEQSDLRDLGPEDDSITQALYLIDQYSKEHWWFDPDLVIHEAMNDLLAARGILTTEGKIKDEQIESLQQKVHLCAAYDRQDHE